MLDLEKIKTLRERRGMTLAEAAVKAGLGSRQKWFDIESGTRPNITLETLGKLAKALGVSPQDLLLK